MNDRHVVGMGIILPSCSGLRDYWSLLSSGSTLIRELQAGWVPQPGTGPAYPGTYLEGVELFDPMFFGISPREAATVDPQHRLLLEVSWRALEQARLTMEQLSELRVGVFAGVGGGDFEKLTISADRTGEMNEYSLTGAVRGMAAGRLAYFLKTTGPVQSLDTTCSSGLVAFHAAERAIATSQCDIAIVAAAHLNRTAPTIAAKHALTALSRQNACRPFDAHADGYALGEGAVCVVLASEEVCRTHDLTRWGRILATAINHDGPSNGLTAPNPHSQAAVIARALKIANLDPDAVTYVEAHGSATPLGDPIEARALGFTYGTRRSAPLAVGSNKGNIGHLESASGLASIVKVLLAAQDRRVPRIAGFHEASHEIDWQGYNLVPVGAKPLELAPGEHRFGVSAFGLSGTNVHVLLSAMVPVAQPRVATAAEPAPGSRRLLALSAKSSAALDQLAADVRDQLSWADQNDLDDFCATLLLGRTLFSERLAVEVDSVNDAVAQLTTYLDNSGEFRGARGRTKSSSQHKQGSSVPATNTAEAFVEASAPAPFADVPHRGWVEVPGHPWKKRLCWPPDLMNYVSAPMRIESDNAQ